MTRRRRAPRWLVETTAWSLALVLMLGVAAALAVETPQPAEVVAPVVAAPPPPTAAPSPSPRPAPTKAPPVLRAAARPELSMEDVLGPPPGPQFDPPPARTAAPADRYAFLVGVQDYRRPTVDTIGSVKDVRFIEAMLVQAGWLPQNIRVVTDAQATGAAIRSGMAWLAERSRPGTFSLFHYSGHVKQRGGTREALWPVDRAWVDDTAVTAALSKARGRLWVDIAGCEAGSFLPGLPSTRTLFSGSSKGTEKSYEYPQWGMSVWTGLLFDLSLRQGQADADRNGRTTMGEALRYSQYYSQVITYGQRPHGRQTPQFAGAGDLGWTLADPPA